eukprot:9402985-Alexandrium_andersonii.AAC.1
MEEIDWDHAPMGATDNRQAKRDATDETPVRRQLRCKTSQEAFVGLASETDDGEPDCSNDDAALEIALRPPEGNRATRLAS